MEKDTTRGGITSGSDSTCPPEETIRRFCGGEIPDDYTPSIIAHLDVCLKCSQVADDYSRGSDLDHFLRLMLPSLAFETEPEYAELASRVELLNPLDSPTEFPILVGDYKILRKVGAGGMGVVYEGEQVRLRKRVAIKVLPSHLADSEKMLARFQREMEALGGVEHPNVVQALDARSEGEQHLLIMEYVDGKTLSELARESKGGLPLEQACNLIKQTAEGLVHLHRRGCIHRDLKPSNLMVNQGGVLKILDLGLARFTDKALEGDATVAGQLVGTIEYVSPEQAIGSSSLTPAADIYSLGCTIFKLLVGRAPFDSAKFSTLEDKLRAHRCEAAPRLRTFRGDVPERLDKFVSRMLSKNPDDRPSADEVVVALSNVKPIPVRAAACRWQFWVPAVAVTCALLAVFILFAVANHASSSRSLTCVEAIVGPVDSSDWWSIDKDKSISFSPKEMGLLSLGSADATEPIEIAVDIQGTSADGQVGLFFAFQDADAQQTYQVVYFSQAAKRLHWQLHELESGEDVPNRYDQSNAVIHTRGDDHTLKLIVVNGELSQVFVDGKQIELPRQNLVRSLPKRGCFGIYSLASGVSITDVRIHGIPIRLKRCR